MGVGDGADGGASGLTVAAGRVAGLDGPVIRQANRDGRGHRLVGEDKFAEIGSVLVTLTVAVMGLGALSARR